MDRVAATLITVGAVLGLAFLAPGQNPSQEWELRTIDRSDRVQFSVDRRRPHEHWRNSSDVPLSNFRGLTRESIERRGPAKFEYVQDAGRLICEGEFTGYRGYGTFTFVPNPEFPAELQRLGYDAPSEDEVLSMMLAGVGLEFARGIRDAGLHASTRQLLDLRIHGVTLEYVREASAAGYTKLDAKDFIDLRIHGVRTAFLGDLKQAGYDLSARQVTDLAIHGVDSRYLRDLRDYGLRPEASDLVQLRIHGVTPEYLKGLKDAGYEKLFAGEITDLRIHGVRTDFILEAKAMGYQFTPRELTSLAVHGVNAAYLRRLKESGYRNLNAGQIEKLRVHGIE